MKCSNCGAEVAQGKFCSFCGSKLPEQDNIIERMFGFVDGQYVFDRGYIINSLQEGVESLCFLVKNAGTLFKDFNEVNFDGRAADRFTIVVVFPTPPFCSATAMIFAISNLPTLSRMHYIQDLNHHTLLLRHNKLWPLLWG